MSGSPGATRNSAASIPLVLEFHRLDYGDHLVDGVNRKQYMELSSQLVFL